MIVLEPIRNRNSRGLKQVHNLPALYIYIYNILWLQKLTDYVTKVFLRFSLLARLSQYCTEASCYTAHTLALIV